MIIGNWLIWLFITAIFTIGTMLSKRLFFAWPAIGAALASLAALSGFGTTWQWGFFVVSFGILFLLFGRKKTHPGSSKKSTCPYCRKRIQIDWVSCPQCGASLECTRSYDDDTRVYRYRGTEPEYPKER